LSTITLTNGQRGLLFDFAAPVFSRVQNLLQTARPLNVKDSGRNGCRILTRHLADYAIGLSLCFLSTFGQNPSEQSRDGLHHRGCRFSILRERKPTQKPTKVLWFTE
jgi:hypothetical protein